MTELLDQPSVVVLVAAAAAVCLILEVALPTAGLAGATGLALGAVAVWGIDRQGEEWWPLFGVVAAVALWGGLIAAHHSGAAAQLAAAGLFLGGALGYAATTQDASAAVTAVAATAALALAFPRIARSADRLSDAPPAVGMESFVGRTVTVSDWEGGRGRVMADGSLWSASGPDGLVPGDEVRVRAAAGLAMQVERVGSPHG